MTARSDFGTISLMSNEKTDKNTGLAQEPHLADLSTLAEAAQWLVTAAVGGVVGNFTYEFVKAKARALIHRYGRRQLLEQVREVSIQQEPQHTLPASEVERRCETLLRDAENEDE